MLVYFTVTKPQRFIAPSSSTTTPDILNTYFHDPASTGEIKVELFMKVTENLVFTAFSAICLTLKTLWSRVLIPTKTPPNQSINLCLRDFLIFVETKAGVKMFS